MNLNLPSPSIVSIIVILAIPIYCSQGYQKRQYRRDNDALKEHLSAIFLVVVVKRFPDLADFRA